MASSSIARDARRGERGRAWRSPTAAALLTPAAVIITTPLLLLALIMLVASPSSFAAPPVPPQCVYTGFAFQMSCSPELEKTSLALTGKATSDPGELNKVDVKKLRDYLQKKAPPPSQECCEAGKTFNDAYCLCAPAMIKEFSQWVNMNQLTEVALFLEKRCHETTNSNENYTLYMEPNCPVRPVYTAEMAAAERKRLAKGVVPIEESVKEVSTGENITTTTPTNATTTTPTNATTTPTNATTTPTTTTTTTPTNTTSP
ncbi:hypothetical protein Vafri_17112 [Volvox africanus]|uniref:Bifunctional inhibitor/plant lipid transfer protein/seed storage helical domain-containing protein n=1 Tax=Volvox africanus TaxID=51714 RepID=A0A8J4F6B1_9CHLO|nr:hypothetical protein Vafri_17112 [Volvox africanus]